jgi:hypothetical protein
MLGSSSVRLIALLLSGSCCTQAFAGTVVRYVNVALTTGADNGTSWANAFRTADGVNRALSAATSGDEIWVARGRYVPSTTGVRTATLALRSNIGIYGGFVGNETTRTDRQPATNITILSGDLANNDPIVTDNSFHVVSGNSAAATAVLDGFTITAGNANAAAGSAGDQDRGGGMIFLSSSNATIRNCTIQNNASTFGGGGTYIRQSSPSFTDCVWQNNQGGFFGGAIDMFNTCAPTFSRCTFRGNTANRAGGIEAFGACTPVLNNCLFVANTAGSAGGAAMYISDSSNVTLRHCTIVRNSSAVPAVGILVNAGTSSFARIRNSIVFGNFTTGGGTASQLTGTTIQATYSCIQGGFSGIGNITADPSFVDANANNFRLAAGSRCIDATNRTETLATEPLDLGGNPRIIDDPSTADTGLGTAPFADMGAYEFQPVPCNSIDFNQNALFPEDQDLIDFLSVLAGGACSNDPNCDDIDFNNDGLFPSDDDLISFLRVLAGGTC